MDLKQIAAGFLLGSVLTQKTQGNNNAKSASNSPVSIYGNNNASSVNQVNNNSNDPVVRKAQENYEKAQENTIEMQNSLVEVNTTIQDFKGTIQEGNETLSLVRNNLSVAQKNGDQQEITKLQDQLQKVEKNLNELNKELNNAETLKKEVQQEIQNSKTQEAEAKKALDEAKAGNSNDTKVQPSPAQTINQPQTNPIQQNQNASPISLNDLYSGKYKLKSNATALDKTGESASDGSTCNIAQTDKEFTTKDGTKYKLVNTETFKDEKTGQTRTVKIFQSEDGKIAKLVGDNSDKNDWANMLHRTISFFEAENA